MKKYFYIVLILSVTFYSCSNTINSVKEPEDTATSGDVAIAVDESFQQLFETQIYTFESLYNRAHIHPQYLPENELLQRLINDSCKVAVMCRDITKEERNTFEAANIYPISTKIAEDAIVLIVNLENSDSILTVEKVKSILQGNDSLWTQLNKKSSLGKINVVFDNVGSANARYMQDTLLKGNTFSKNVFAVKSNSDVITYVNKNKNALGIISGNLISDLDDPKVQAILKQVKVLALSLTDDAIAVKPYQAYIKTKEYPFTRGIYMINRQTRSGLGMGFVSFVAGEKGQLMILKAGLVPGFPPERLVKIKME